MLVDAMTMRMTLRPQTLDTIVAPICTPIFFPTSRPHWRDRSESRQPPISIQNESSPRCSNRFTFGLRHHGKGIANPVGTFWSAVMMLEHLGEKAAAKRLMRAIERVDRRTIAPHRRTSEARSTTA